MSMGIMDMMQPKARAVSTPSQMDQFGQFRLPNSLDELPVDQRGRYKELVKALIGG